MTEPTSGRETLVEIYPDSDANCLCCEGGTRLPKRLHETKNKTSGGAPIYVCAECQGGKARAPLDAAQAEIARLKERQPEAAPEGFTLVPNVALKWLNGEGPDHEGSWFGECQPDIENKYPRKYWWRSHFQKICEALPAPKPATPASAGAGARKKAPFTDFVYSGWLIERDCVDGIEYVHTFAEWTRDANKALRFNRQGDAEDTVQVFFDEVNGIRIVEHAWDDGRGRGADAARNAGLEEAAKWHANKAAQHRADADRWAKSDHKPNQKLVVPTIRLAEDHEYFAKRIRALSSAPAPASGQESVKALDAPALAALIHEAFDKTDPDGWLEDYPSAYSSRTSIDGAWDFEKVAAYVLDRLSATGDGK
jgi:hypothetical protein